ncbi:AroM family protein [Sporomusa aerivorans]|uniref:AroM family protein n=1 Tax=Sporomusa aerivorans TaxID=204936 RepID=UPI00352A89F6
MGKKIGAVTIGQSPRTDVVPEILQLMGNIELVEGGALDGLTYEEITALAPTAGDYVLVTRLSDGRAVKIAEKYILERLQAQIDRLVKEGAAGIVMLCSGEFPAFSCPKPLLYPQLLLTNFIQAVAGGKKLGIITPDADQVPQVTKRWAAAGVAAVQARPASPYAAEAKIWQAADALKDWGAELIVMDCIGFNQSMRNEVTRITGVPAVLPRTVAARAVAELFA